MVDLATKTLRMTIEQVASQRKAIVARVLSTASPLGRFGDNSDRTQNLDANLTENTMITSITWMTSQCATTAVDAYCQNLSLLDRQVNVLQLLLEAIRWYAFSAAYNLHSQRARLIGGIIASH